MPGMTTSRPRGRTALFIVITGVLAFSAACSRGPSPDGPDNTALPTGVAVAPTAALAATSTISPTLVPSLVDTSVPATRAPAPAATVTPTAVPEPGGRVPQAVPVPPERDVYELARRLLLKTSDPVARFTSPPPGPLEVGDRLTWNVNRDSGDVQVSATVARVSDHAYWVFDDQFTPDEQRLDRAVEEFESVIWPTVTGGFGPVWSPGIDGDERIVIFHSRLRSGVAGYYSGSDEYPRLIQPQSNEREAIYLSADRVALAGTHYMATLAHELQHAVHWAADPTEESWVNEGLAEVAASLAGYSSGSITAYLRAPDTSLLQWAPDVFQASPNYGAAALFFRYLSDNYGGTATLRELLTNQSDGYLSVDETLRRLGYTETTEDVFADWAVASVVNDTTGKYSYSQRDFGTPSFRRVSKPETAQGDVRVFGVDYWRVDFDSPQVTITFDGAETGRIFPAAPYSGDTCWWSNVGDSIDATLTRPVDLTAVESATLTYQVWHAIELDWDYAYIEASTDGGVTWTIIPTRLSSSTNPNNVAYGPGLTGNTGTWVEDSADLSEYAGQEILLRFEYITDDAIHDRGACFDDFAITAIGWQDDTSTGADWDARGFVRINSTQPIRYLVQVVRDTVDAPATAVRMQLDDANRGSTIIENIGDDETITVVISMITTDVSGAAEYTLEIGR